MTRFRKVIEGLALLVLAASLVVAQQPGPDRQSRDDAWWTGPLLAPSAATLPPGHFLIEPYFYDVITEGSFAADGTRKSAPHANGFGSFTYALYGLAPKFTIGMIPTFTYNDLSTGPSSSVPQMGDLTLQAQYGLTNFRDGRWLPTMSVAVQETLPTGRYDPSRRPSQRRRR